MTEAVLGYPNHRWLALGHLAEAESETVRDFRMLAVMIREERKKYEEDENYPVPIVSLIQKATDEHLRSSDMQREGGAG